MDSDGVAKSCLDERYCLSLLRGDPSNSRYSCGMCQCHTFLLLLAYHSIRCLSEQTSPLAYYTCEYCSNPKSRSSPRLTTTATLIE
ncbi:hypothetical protein PC128_g20248 [Phytophthora cactorum]|nr:hypothetical protein PC128_g20248 [Phytophthora cactorum]